MAWRQCLRAVSLAMFLVLGGPTLAVACSVVDTYVRPSNFELVQIADVIVVATPLRDAARSNGGPFDAKTRFRVDQVLKGQAPAEIDVTGLGVGRIRPSDPDNIAYSHPQGHAGPCNRVTVSRDAVYILFLSKRGEQYATLGYPFSRVSEDYAGEDALWARAVRTYLRLQSAEAPMQQLASLEAIRAEILANPKRTAADTALADDIEQHLGSVSPWKPTEYLLTALADLKAGRPPRYRPRDAKLEGEQSAADALARLLLADLTEDRPAEPKPRRSPLEERILTSLLEGSHPEAMPLFEAFARPSTPPEELAMAIRFMASNGRYHEAYELIETRAVPMMAAAGEADFLTLAGAISNAQQDPFYGEGQPRWRSDAEIAGRWPQMALRLSSLSEERFGRGLEYVETLKTLLGEDLRATPELTFTLSGHDNSITDWAAAELVKPETLKASRDHVGSSVADPLFLPLRIELHWHGLSDEPIDGLAGVFCLGLRQRRMLLEEWGRIGGEQSARALLRLAASPSMTREDRAVLADAIPLWDRRYSATYGESWQAADKAMQKLARGEPIGVADIKPLEPVVCPAPK